METRYFCDRFLFISYMQDVRKSVSNNTEFYLFEKYFEIQSTCIHNYSLMKDMRLLIPLWMTKYLQKENKKHFQKTFSDRWKGIQKSDETIFKIVK